MLKIPLDTTDGIYRYVGYVSHVPVGADFYRFAEKSAPTAKRPNIAYVTKNYDVYYKHQVMHHGSRGESRAS